VGTEPESTAAETVTVEQFAVRYTNHYRPDRKVVTLGNWDAWFDTVDIIRDLKQQGYEPELLRREVTRIYGAWEPSAAALPLPVPQEEQNP
jgi:hypothetical protein